MEFKSRIPFNVVGAWECKHCKTSNQVVINNCKKIQTGVDTIPRTYRICQNCKTQLHLEITDLKPKYHIYNTPFVVEIDIRVPNSYTNDLYSF